MFALTLSVLAAGARAQAREPAISTAIDTATISVGDPVTVTVRVRHAPDATVEWPDAIDLGSVANPNPTDPIVALASTPLGDGYWLVTAHGRVHRFGRAKHFGGLVSELDAQLDIANYESYGALRAEARRLAREQSIVAIASTPTGTGYWLVGADGMVFGRGDAADFGDATPPGEAVVFAISRRL